MELASKIATKSRDLDHLSVPSNKETVLLDSLKTRMIPWTVTY